MDVVALLQLGCPIEEEAPRLAKDLGMTAYEARQKLAAGMPSVVLMTNDRARTIALLKDLRSRGHDAVACDGKAVVPSAGMDVVRAFHFDEDALVLDVAEGEAGEPVRVRYGEMLALVRAVHRHTQESEGEVREKKLRPIAAVATGGLVMTKTIKRDVRTVSEDKEGVLYIFQSDKVPALLCETSAQYSGLGTLARPTRKENFAKTVELLRQRTSAPYDDRLLTAKRSPELPPEPGERRAFDPENGGTDLLAHLLAMWLTKVDRS